MLLNPRFVAPVISTAGRDLSLSIISLRLRVFATKNSINSPRRARGVSCIAPDVFMHLLPLPEVKVRDEGLSLSSFPFQLFSALSCLCDKDYY